MDPHRFFKGQTVVHKELGQLVVQRDYDNYLLLTSCGKCILKSSLIFWELSYD